MDDLELFEKIHEQIAFLVEAVHILSQGIGTEFGLKCRRVMKQVYGKYLGVLEVSKIKEHVMKDIVVGEYKRRLKLVLKAKLDGQNKVCGNRERRERL